MRRLGGLGGLVGEVNIRKAGATGRPGGRVWEAAASPSTLGDYWLGSNWGRTGEPSDPGSGHHHRRRRHDHDHDLLISWRENDNKIMFTRGIMDCL